MKTNDNPAFGDDQAHEGRRQFLQNLSGLIVTTTLPNNSPMDVPVQVPVDTAGRGTGVPVSLRINDCTYQLTLEPRVTLLDALREYIGLTGTKKGCGHGQCGACTVHIDGRRVNSCLTLAVMHQSHSISTIEGLAEGDTLHPVQSAFITHDAFQCGYCTPGQIMSAVSCIQEGHTGTDAEIKEWMSGNICRCGAYPHILAAVNEAKQHTT